MDGHRWRPRAGIALAILLAAIVQDVAVETVRVSTTRTVRNGLSAGLQRLVETSLDQIEVA